MLLLLYYIIYNYICYRQMFKDIQTVYLHEQFEKYALKNPISHKYKPRYWNFNSNDLYKNLSLYKERLLCIRVSDTYYIIL